MSSYDSTSQYLAGKDKAQEHADKSMNSQAYGFCSYAGWTHVDASDEFAVAELGDVTTVTPVNE